MSKYLMNKYIIKYPGIRYGEKMGPIASKDGIKRFSGETGAMWLGDSDWVGLRWWVESRCFRGAGQSARVLRAGCGGDTAP